MKYLYLFFIFSISSLLFFSCKKNVQNNEDVKNNQEEPLKEKKQGVLLEITSEELLTMLKYDKNAFVIDVRKADKKIRSCKLIEGYKHLEDSLVYKDPSILPKGKSIVLLSKTGERSKKLGEFLVKKGKTVYNLKNGMDGYWAWREKLIRDKLHLYDDQINFIELYADDFGC